MLCQWLAQTLTELLTFRPCTVADYEPHCCSHSDEIDYIGKRRSDHSGQSLALDRESTLTQLLSEMDGFAPSDGIVVMATTNRQDILDPALMRSGRFGMIIEFEAPDRCVCSKCSAQQQLCLTTKCNRHSHLGACVRLT